MPGFDGRGPMGAGPMTGGGRGFCNPARNSEGFAGGSGAGRGLGRGLGLRRGCGFGFGRGGGYGRGLGSTGFYPARSAGYAPFYSGYAANPQDEAAALRREAEFLKQDLDAVNSRISELESKNTQS